MDKPLLDLKNLRLGFHNEQGYTEVVHGINFQVAQGEIVGLVGESGSGKTLSMKALFGAPEEAFVYQVDHLYFDGNPLMDLSEKSWNALRGKHIAYIPQNASDALTPHQTIERQLKETARVHKIDLTKAQMMEKLQGVGIQNCEAVLSMYPRQLSGGMAQRVLIAMSTLLNPKLIIADEPTSAIDASLKNMVLNLLMSINQKHQTSIIVITHDFDVVSKMCQRAYVMHRGHMMEEGAVFDLLHSPYSTYTEGLVKCFASLSDPGPEFYTMPEKGGI